MTTIRIDSHQHFWDPSAFHYPWMGGEELASIRRPFGPDDLETALRRNKIDGTVLVQTVSDVHETRQFLQTATDTEWVKGVVGWVDLAAPGVGDLLDELAESFPTKLVGVRHQAHDEEDPNWLLREDVRSGLAELSSRNLRYDLLVRTRELPAAITIARDLPDVGFVLDHIAKPPISAGWSEEWAGLIDELGTLENVYVKLSGMATEAAWDRWDAHSLRPYIEHVLTAFTPDRAMFGSDWPVCLLAAASYDEVLYAVEVNSLGLSLAERASVLGENAVRFYSLQV